MRDGKVDPEQICHDLENGNCSKCGKLACRENKSIKKVRKGRCNMGTDIKIAKHPEDSVVIINGQDISDFIRGISVKQTADSYAMINVKIFVNEFIEIEDGVAIFDFNLDDYELTNEIKKALYLKLEEELEEEGCI
jgi:hypothetical protein